MSKLSDFLTQHKLDARRVLTTSKGLERLMPKDRAVRLARRQAKAGVEAAKELAAQAVKSGRKLAKPTLDRALRGDAVTTGARKRILRAVNAVLAAKKQTEITAKELF